MPAIELPEGYSYVLAAAASTVYLNTWQILKVGRARKAAKVAFPQVYADKEEQAKEKDALIFNCLQRAHQHTLETVPHVLLAILMSGLKHPYLAAGLGSAWTLGRVLFTLGYGTGDPAKRYKMGGFLMPLSTIAMIATMSYTVFEFLKECL